MAVSVARVQAREHYIEPFTVHFTDGHSLRIEPNEGGLGGDAGRYVQRVLLQYARAVVATFNSPYQYPINFRPFGFVTMGAGYTPARVAQYWRAAYDHLTVEQQAGRHHRAWFAIAATGQALREVEAGKWSAPARR